MSMANIVRAAGLSLALLVAGSPAFAKAPAHAAKPAPVWVAAWASAQMIPDPKNALGPDDLKDATLRQIVRMPMGATRFRIKVSNVFGTTPLHLNAVEVALAAAPGTPRTQPNSSHTVTFAGQHEVTVPAGADYVSDPISMQVSALTNLAITTWQVDAPLQQTSHPGSRTTSFLVHGNHVADTDFDAPQTFDHWFQISGIEAEGTSASGAIAILGDSITDGYGTITNGNTRWPDFLMERLQAAKSPLSILNLGIGGNRLLLDGTGPNALARLDRDVLSQPDVRYLVVLEGVNDLGMSTRDSLISGAEHDALVARLTASYQQIIDRAHARGIKVIGATVLPYNGNTYYHPDSSNEADRQAINAWIRAPGHFDAVIDFDALTRDPQALDRMKAQYDSGDHLHPSVAGYKAMGEFVDLTLFAK